MASRLTFTSTQQAKDYLVKKIVEQAAYEQAPLSEAETKMLYYSVDQPGVGDAVAAEFDEESSEYEQRVAQLFSRRYEREKERGDLGEAKSIADAVALLATEDHYLNVMIAQSKPASTTNPSNSQVLRQALWILGPLVLLGLVVVFWDRL